MHSKDVALAGEACRWAYGVRRGVFDVGHIAGVADASVEVKRPGVTSDFLGLFSVSWIKRKGTVWCPSCIVDQATFRVALQRCPLSSPDGPKIASSTAGELVNDVDA